MLGVLWLLSQVFTDIVRGSTYDDFFRGWSNISFFLLEFLAIYLLLGKNKRRLLLFAFGISIGQILAYLINPNIFLKSPDYTFFFQALFNSWNLAESDQEKGAA